MAKHFLAHIFHAPEKGTVERINDALISVSDSGVIDRLLSPADSSYEAAIAETEPENCRDLRPEGFLLPGFIDLHIHAPQFPQLGEALDIPLEDWLQHYTFPLEARYSDAGFAEEVYSSLVRTLLSYGTTTGVYFATIHHEASLKLAEICLELGQRAVVGRVAMDDPATCPDYYRDPDAKASIDLTERFIGEVEALPGNSAGLVRPCITPRFIPSCSDAALKGLGDLAEKTGLHVQTHCSESDWEHHYVLERCGMRDTEALDEFGLLTERTVLAHANFIDDGDMALIRERGAGVAHCPLSNIYFSNAVFPLRRALEKAVKVGLGTDISGGPSASLFEGCRKAIGLSKVLQDGTDARKSAADRGVPESRIDFRDAFYCATTGGADVLGFPAGFFAPGRHFDAMTVQIPEQYHLTANRSPDSDDLLQKLIMLAERQDVRETFVAGQSVHRLKDAGPANSR